MILYDNKEIEYKGCPGCAFANHEFAVTAGMAYEDDEFTISQDWEIPIPGFYIISPKRHVSKLSELTNDERNRMFELANMVVSILRENNICEYYDYIFEEKNNRHLHVWLLPRYEWMKEISGDIIGHIDDIFEYARNNMKTESNYEQINEITKIISLKM